jgi:hypothetical protein
MADVTVIPTEGVITPGDLNRNLAKYSRHTAGPFLVTPEGGGTTEVEVEVPVERAITYHKRGFYPVSAEFEYWQTEDPEGAPPSGNPLIDVTILAASDRS